jgi:hypothetical protein
MLGHNSPSLLPFLMKYELSLGTRLDIGIVFFFLLGYPRNFLKCETTFV